LFSFVWKVEAAAAEVLSLTALTDVLGEFEILLESVRIRRLRPAVDDTDRSSSDFSSFDFPAKMSSMFFCAEDVKFWI
jgi:hypothetical protein